jgi:hypothetical protein
MDHHKNGGGGKTHLGNFWGFCCYKSHFLLVYDYLRFLPHRQCWEQERTTCSGGYPSATCSAFLRTTVRGVLCNLVLCGGCTTVDMVEWLSLCIFDEYCYVVL